MQKSRQRTIVIAVSREAAAVKPPNPLKGLNNIPVICDTLIIRRDRKSKSNKYFINIHYLIFKK
jgi:hypothetical protein